MKKYLIIFSALALVACNNSQKAVEAANRENEIRQRTIDSIALVNANARNQHSGSVNNSSSSTTNNTENTSTEPAKKKGMNNKTKGALIGAGSGIVGGALTGAAVSSDKDKGKGALIGGAVGGAVGTGVGYGIGANEDKKAKAKQDSINRSK